MKNKILGIILLVGFCNNIFGLHFINNTKYRISIAISKVTDKENYFNNFIIESLQEADINPFNVEGKMLIGFGYKHSYGIPFPNGNIRIDEDDNYFFVNSEGEGYIQFDKTKVFKDVESPDEEELNQNNKNNAKNNFFTWKKIALFGSVAAIAGYFIWNNYNKKQKTNTTK